MWYYLELNATLRDNKKDCYRAFCDVYSHSSPTAFRGAEKKEKVPCLYKPHVLFSVESLTSSERENFVTILLEILVGRWNQLPLVDIEFFSLLWLLLKLFSSHCMLRTFIIMLLFIEHFNIFLPHYWKY